MDNSDPSDLFLVATFFSRLHGARLLSPSRLLSFAAIAMLSLFGCREERKLSRRGETVPGLSSLLARTVTLLNEHGYDSMVVAAPQDSICITRDSTRTVCRTESGDSAVFLSWKIPEEPQQEGDMLQFVVLGRFSVNPRLRVLEIRLGHDAPFQLLWDPRTGRFAIFSLNYDSVWVSTSRKTILLVPMDKDDFHPDPVRFLTEIDGTPAGWRCGIRPDSLRIDSAVLVHSRDSIYVHPDSLAHFPALRCQPDTTLWARKVPDWLSQTVEQVMAPVLLQNSTPASHP